MFRASSVALETSRVPAFDTTPQHHGHQRKLIVYGARAREKPEDVCERNEALGTPRHPFTALFSLHDNCQTTIRVSGFEPSRTGCYQQEIYQLVSRHYEHNSLVPQYLRDIAKELRSGSIDEVLFEPLLKALKMILSDSSEGTDVNAFLNSGISSVLSPCRLAANCGSDYDNWA
ncbi:hypothetical protein OG21DRAFT_1488873 [Imleria badia]|nr:hypothetical protein OG21DRAFT_1488873 [Imleria badia]